MEVLATAIHPIRLTGLAHYKPTSTHVMFGFPTYNFIYDLRVNQVTRSLKLNTGPCIPSRTDHLAISEMSVAAGVDPTVMVSATTSGSRYTERQRVTHHTKFYRTQHTPSQGRTRLQPTEHHNYEIQVRIQLAMFIPRPLKNMGF